MTTPESDYFNGLSEPEQERFEELLSTWHNLGLVGCADCKVAEWVNESLADKEHDFAMAMTIGGLTHYAIELNGSKRPSEDGLSLHGEKYDDFNSPTLFKIAARLGIDEESFEQFSNDFQQCIRCPSAISITGGTPSVNEVMELHQAER